MKKGFLMTFALVLVAVGAYFVSGTYARYTEKVTKEGTAAVAEWSFSEDNLSTTKNDDGSLKDNPLVINLADTYDATTLANGKIAPGTKGYFDIVLSNLHTDTAVDVNVKVVANAPTNLKFCKDQECVTPYTSEQLANGLEGKLTPNDTAKTKRIYWKWDYNTAPDESIDTADTEDGTTAENMTVALTITGTQIAPGVGTTNSVTSNWANITEDGTPIPE